MGSHLTQQEPISSGELLALSVGAVRWASHKLVDGALSRLEEVLDMPIPASPVDPIESRDDFGLSDLGFPPEVAAGVVRKRLQPEHRHIEVAHD